MTFVLLLGVLLGFTETWRLGVTFTAILLDSVLQYIIEMLQCSDEVV
jgi:hypothetical protein